MCFVFCICNYGKIGVPFKILVCPRYVSSLGEIISIKSRNYFVETYVKSKRMKYDAARVQF